LAPAGYLLNKAIVRAMADPSVRQRLADLGQEIYPPELQTPEACRKSGASLAIPLLLVGPVGMGRKLPGAVI
jgi:hypothetical protein